MKRRSIIIGAICLGILLAWMALQDGTVFNGAHPPFGPERPSSIEVFLWSSDTPLGIITNAQACSNLVDIMHTGREVEAHWCIPRGRMILNFPGDRVARINFLPGHRYFRYEFTYNGANYSLPQSDFLGSLKAGGIDIGRIPVK
jgi:hypothetical protein